MIHITAQGITNVVFRASMRRIMLLQAESKNRHALLDADNCSLTHAISKKGVEIRQFRHPVFSHLQASRDDRKYVSFLNR